mgnify:CR=1 FL=1
MCPPPLTAGVGAAAEVGKDGGNVDLNEKQLRFCEEYIIDLNATQAAIRAGYSKKLHTAKDSGC